ncbi:MAG: hypothetical protein AB7N80_00575 [Bdellovibrionales bacterium]
MIKSFVFSLLFILMSQADGFEGLTQPNSKCACTSQAGDFLEAPQAFNFGRFKGQCIDSCRFRGARILSKSPYPKVKIGPGEVMVGNVLHLETFHTALVPLHGVEKAEVGFEEFSPGIFHVFLRFTLSEASPSIRLFGQNQRPHTVAKTRTLVLSSEGVPPHDHKYDLLESYFGHYLMVHRVTSGEESVRWTSKLKHPVKYHALNVTAAQAAQILKGGLVESDKTQLQNIYQLFTNNCATAALGFIDKGLAGSVVVPAPFLQMDKALPLAGPLGTLRFLQARNLVVEDMPTHTRLNVVGLLSRLGRLSKTQ